jgi:hypothetical protein
MRHSSLMKAQRENGLACSVSSFRSRTDGIAHSASFAHLTEGKIATGVVRSSVMEEGS